MLLTSLTKDKQCKTLYFPLDGLYLQYVHSMVGSAHISYASRLRSLRVKGAENVLAVPGSPPEEWVPSAAFRDDNIT